METQASHFHSIADFRAAAKRRLPRMVFEFIDGGAGSELTLRENRAALDRVRLVGSAPVDMSARSQETSLFGRPMALPIIIGPTGLAGLAWPKADLHLCRAAGEQGIPFVMSTAATATLSEVAGAGAGRKWFQLYILRDRNATRALIGEVKRLGFEAIEITVDSSIGGRRLKDARNGFSIPFQWTPRKIANVAMHPRWAAQMMKAGSPRLELLASTLGLQKTNTIAEAMQTQLDPSVTWDDIKWVRDQWPGPLIVKGLLDPRQAGHAAEVGLDGVVLSNHGGRQLDGAVATIDMLPEFVAEVGDRLAIIMDSGFRTGTDIAKALALGASAVQLGRATLYAAAVGGHAAVQRALEILRAELDVAQALMGASLISDFSADMVRGAVRAETPSRQEVAPKIVAERATRSLAVIR